MGVVMNGSFICWFASCRQCLSISSISRPYQFIPYASDRTGYPSLSLSGSLYPPIYPECIIPSPDSTPPCVAQFNAQHQSPQREGRNQKSLSLASRNAPKSCIATEFTRNGSEKWKYRPLAKARRIVHASGPVPYSELFPCCWETAPQQMTRG